MILDKFLMFSNKQAIATGDSDVLDFVEGGDAIGQELTLNVMAVSAVTGSVSVKLQTADNAEGDWKDLVISPTVTNVPAGGTIFKIRVPQGMKRFAKLVYTADGATGTVSAFLSKEI